jgi:hypothetical protein
MSKGLRMITLTLMSMDEKHTSNPPSLLMDENSYPSCYPDHVRTHTHTHVKRKGKKRVYALGERQVEDE